MAQSVGKGARREVGIGRFVGVRRLISFDAYEENRRLLLLLVLRRNDQQPVTAIVYGFSKDAGDAGETVLLTIQARRLLARVPLRRRDTARERVGRPEQRWVGANRRGPEAFSIPAPTRDKDQRHRQAPQTCDRLIDAGSAERQYRV